MENFGLTLAVWIYFGLLVILLLSAYCRISYIKKSLEQWTNDSTGLLNLGADSVIRIIDDTEHEKEIVLNVKYKHIYQENDLYWVEYECVDNYGETVWLEVEVEDGEYKINMSLKKLEFSDLNITPYRLDQFDYDERGYIHYKDETFDYVDSDKAIFYEYGEKRAGRKVYYWQFINVTKNITVERWSKKEHDIYYNKLIPVSNVQVIARNYSGDYREW